MIQDSALHYKIEKKLGEGGTSEVFLATDTKLDRRVTLKSLPPHTTNHPDFKARFEHEAMTLPGRLFQSCVNSAGLQSVVVLLP